MSDDDHTPVVSPRARRVSTGSVDLFDLVLADIVAWAEQSFARSDVGGAVRLPPVPVGVVERNRKRLESVIRRFSASEIEEAEKLRARVKALEEEVRELTRKNLEYATLMRVK